MNEENYFQRRSLTCRLSLGAKPTSVHLATNRSPALGAIGSNIIPSLSVISNLGIVSPSARRRFVQRQNINTNHRHIQIVFR